MENAINHGLPPDRNLNIEIEGKIDGKVIEISVSNDGKPIEKLNPRTALNNLSERLRLLLGGELKWELGEKTKFTMRFPKR